MKTKKYVGLSGLATLLDNLKDLYATKEFADSVGEDTNTYILDVDYSVLEFDTSEIVG